MKLLDQDRNEVESLNLGTLEAGKTKEYDYFLHNDTDDSKLYICYNHGGTIKTTEMT